MPKRISDTRLELARARDKARRERDTERRNARKSKRESVARFSK